MADFKLGVCTWTFGDQPLSRTAERLSALGYDGVELFGGLSMYTAAEAGKILRDNGLEVFSLTPDNVDITHPDPAIRRSALDYYARLIDFAAELGKPLVSCHGLVTRTAAISSQQEEDAVLVTAVKQICQWAKASGLRVVFEVLNRYETHQINTGVQALELVKAVGADNFGVLLDAYHMNIEEPDPAQAIRDAGKQLWLYHVGDSNRRAVGRGHTDFAGQLKALAEVGYNGPVIMELTAPGPNPFTTDKGPGWRATLEQFLTESRQWFQTH